MKEKVQVEHQKWHARIYPYSLDNSEYKNYIFYLALQNFESQIDDGKIIQINFDIIEEDIEEEDIEEQYQNFSVKGQVLITNQIYGYFYFYLNQIQKNNICEIKEFRVNLRNSLKLLNFQIKSQILLSLVSNNQIDYNIDQDNNNNGTILLIQIISKQDCEFIMEFDSKNEIQRMTKNDLRQINYQENMLKNTISSHVKELFLQQTDKTDRNLEINAINIFSNLLGSLTFGLVEIIYQPLIKYELQSQKNIFIFSLVESRYKMPFVNSNTFGFYIYILCMWDQQLCLYIVDNWFQSQTSEGSFPLILKFVRQEQADFQTQFQLINNEYLYYLEEEHSYQNNKDNNCHLEQALSLIHFPSIIFPLKYLFVQFSNQFLKSKELPHFNKHLLNFLMDEAQIKLQKYLNFIKFAHVQQFSQDHFNFKFQEDCNLFSLFSPNQKFDIDLHSIVYYLQSYLDYMQQNEFFFITQNVIESKYTIFDEHIIRVKNYFELQNRFQEIFNDIIDLIKQRNQQDNILGFQQYQQNFQDHSSDFSFKECMPFLLDIINEEVIQKYQNHFYFDKIQQYYQFIIKEVTSTDNLLSKFGLKQDRDSHINILLNFLYLKQSYLYFKAYSENFSTSQKQIAESYENISSINIKTVFEEVKKTKNVYSIYNKSTGRGIGKPSNVGSIILAILKEEYT